MTSPNDIRPTRLPSGAVNSEGASAAIEVEDLTVSYGPIPALLDISLTVQEGKLVGIIGPNGSGKSTLMKSMLGFIKPDVGSVRIFGGDVSSVKGRVAYVPQRGSVDWDFPITVREVAAMGRYSYRRWWRDLTLNDYQLAEDALEKVRMSDFKKSQIGQLSGGQQQRVFMARALAQDADILLLDEPFAGVDAATERAILDVLDNLKNEGKTVVVVHHDLATAAEYFDLLILLKQRLFGFGTPDTILNPQLLSDVYEGTLRVFAELEKRKETEGPEGTGQTHV